MTQTISVSAKTIDQIFARLDILTNELKEIKTRLFEEPSHGSEEWWKWSENRGREEIKAGKGTIIHNKKELDKFFKTL